MPPKLLLTPEEIILKKKAKKRAYRLRYLANPANKAAESARTSAWHKANPDKRRVHTQRWNDANRAHKNAHGRMKYAENIEFSRARGRKHAQTHREKHPDTVRAQGRAWRHAHKEQDRTIKKAYSKKHPEYVLRHNSRARARRANAPIRDLTTAQWEMIKEHYGHRCVYCQRKMERLTQDHIIPLSKGGSHTLSNVVPACKSCNSKKGAGKPLIPVQPLLL